MHDESIDDRGVGEARPATRKQKILAAIIFVPVAALFGWGMLRAPLHDRDAMARCMNPYFAAEDGDRWGEAWDGYTSDAYKQTTPRDVYLAALGRTRAERGRVVRREKTTSSGFADFNGAKGFNASFWLYFEHGEPAYVFYRIVRSADGAWRVDSIRERTTGRQLAPGPW